MNDTASMAKGRWRAILAQLGVPARHLTGRHGPCPFCGGRDRYRFDDREGRGTFICNRCGAGDGFQFLERYHGWEFKAAARRVDLVVGEASEERPRPKGDPREALRRLMLGALRIGGTPTERYLRRRGVDIAPADVWHHPGCWEPETRRELPAMLAVVRDPEGRAVSVHRTYLTPDGRKAPLASPRKVMPPIGTIRGAAVRLAPAGDTLGVAEGIENALSARLIEAARMPVWAAISAGGVQTVEIPESVRAVWIFGDVDANFVGQSAAYALARRMATEGRETVVMFPPGPLGSDWNDELLSRLRSARKARSA